MATPSLSELSLPELLELFKQNPFDIIMLRDSFDPKLLLETIKKCDCCYRHKHGRDIRSCLAGFDITRCYRHRHSKICSSTCSAPEKCDTCSCNCRFLFRQIQEDYCLEC